MDTATKIGKEMIAFLEDIEETYESRISELEDRQKEQASALEALKGKVIEDVQGIRRQVDEIEKEFDNKE